MDVQPPDHFFPPKVVDAGNGLAVGVACPSAATIEASRVPFPTTIVVVSQPEWVHDRVFEGVDYVSLSQRLWFRRAYILRHEDDVVLSSLSLKNTSSSSHGSSRLLKKRVSDNVQYIFDIMK